MKKMIYYPGFEIKDETWLKFALLYFDNLSPIIPEQQLSNKKNFSESFNKIIGETDLITPHHPTNDDVTIASVSACEELDNYLKNPERYRPIFGHNNSANLLETWRRIDKQTTTFFQEKFTPDFFSYCINNKLATKCDEGMKISPDVAFVYMSFLANTISQNNEIEMITDLAQYSMISRKNEHNSSSIVSDIEGFNKDTILHIPQNLDIIPIDTILELRKQKNFNECRKAYMREVYKQIESKEQNQEYDHTQLRSSKNEFISIANNVFIMAATVALCCTTKDFNLTRDIATAYIGAENMTRSIERICESTGIIQNKKKIKKFLAEINKLK